MGGRWGLRFTGLPGRGWTYLLAQQFLGLGPKMGVLIIIEELLVQAGVLRANHALAIDENHQWNQGPLALRPLQILERPRSAGRPYREERIEALDEAGDVGILVNCSLYHLKTPGPQILFDATQDLSGFLAVGSSSENKGEAQDLAAIVAYADLLAVQ